MSYRNIIVANPARIFVKNSQLIVETDIAHSVPIEDISTVLIENKQTTITAAALSLLGQNGCAVYLCDDKHMPCSVLTPYCQHSRTLRVINAQLDASEVLKKQLWRDVVVSKISNQAECLRLCGKDNAAVGLTEMSKRVKSGDGENIEAAAAARYFPALFGDDFTRETEDNINSALNYGYAILRGNIARFLTVYGLMPSVGIHHKSELNRFNLADDVIEPFRPVVDLLVATALNNETALDSAKKAQLQLVLNINVLHNGKKLSVNYAMEKTIQSLTVSFEKGKDFIVLPKLLPMEQHSYE